MSGVFGRVIKKVETPTHSLRVYNNFEWGEYVAVIFLKIGGVLSNVVISTYHCDDKEEAMATGQSALAEAAEQNLNTPLDREYW